MSRIGKLPINIPEKVELMHESDITVKGKFGTLQTKVPEVILLLKMVVS
jgi:ribosomal protein L6P/L9E